VLVAVMVNVPGVGAVNVAVSPLGVRVPPDGVAAQVTPPEQDDVALAVAVNVAATPVFIVAELALTPTLVTVHFGGVLPVLVGPPAPPHADCRSTTAPAVIQ
jgi:hypothetical protein